MVLLASFGHATNAEAAGGSHFVDDAGMLAPGECQLETWGDREAKGNRKLFHVGPACRAGPVEVGLNLDRTSRRGFGDVSVSGLQVKWARPLDGSFSAGVIVAAGWQNVFSHFAGATVVVPLTWQAGTTLMAHANLGWDFRPSSTDTLRAGVSVEWTPLQAWSMVAERFRESDTTYWRVGARYAWSSHLSIDLTRAGGINSSIRPWWTLGLTHLFER